MKALLLPPLEPAAEAMLVERRRLGLDGRDEMWDGVLHVVPPPGGPHQRLSTELMVVLHPLAKARGLQPMMETGLYGSTKNFRVPDQLYCRPEQVSERGAEGAELVVEIRSPGDETYDKLSYYSARGVREMLVVHPQPGRVELFRAVDGELRPAEDTRSQVLDVTVTATDKGLRIGWEGGFAEI